MSSSLTLPPIGYIRTQKQVKFHARHQPAENEVEHNVLELLPDCRYEEALQDLAGFSRVWLVWWFHRNTEWRPKVLPRADRRNEGECLRHVRRTGQIRWGSLRCS